MMTIKQAYLTNAALLRAIDNSKQTYCSFLSPEFSVYHAIVEDRSLVTADLITSILDERALRKGKRAVVPLAPEDVVVRVMTYEHVPLDPERKRKARNMTEPYAKTNFPPFQHFILRDGELKEVGRSHWTGGFENGCFSADHGRITTELAMMFMLLVERIARRGNWRNYSYLDEMEGNAIQQLCYSGLQFNEARSNNPFAFLTTLVNHAFTRILNLEKKAQTIRDDILQEAGAMPSSSRQIDHELRHMHVPEPIKKSPGPSPKGAGRSAVDR